MKRLSQLLSGEMRQGNDRLITSIAYDSGDVSEGCLFFALPGTHADGHSYVDAALDAGAAAVVHSKPLNSYRADVAYVRVPDTRAAMSPISAAFWDYPSKELKVVGVTGTDGKSTTVSLIRQLLESTGISAGSVSTVNFAVGGYVGSNSLRQSTPEAPQIHGLLRSMADAGQTHAVIEATSHGLSLRNSRLEDVEFDAAVLTNVTSEHLEFHGNLETYRADKMRLFQMVARARNRESFGVVNGDDALAPAFEQAAGGRKVYSYSMKNQAADLFAVPISAGPRGVAFTLHTSEGKCDTRISLPGLFNVENTLAALCAVGGLQKASVFDFAPHLPSLKGVRGRMEPIAGSMDFHVMIDYAHSPGSFAKILPFLKTLSEGRLIVVFGSAGERDVEKRSKQGALAAQHADLVFLTDEDPRGEDSTAILNDIASGAKTMVRGENLFLIPERREAIREAFQNARFGDLVALLGKGHENSIIGMNGKQPWDEAETSREILRDLGYEV